MPTFSTLTTAAVLALLVAGLPAQANVVAGGYAFNPGVGIMLTSTLRVPLVQSPASGDARRQQAAAPCPPLPAAPLFVADPTMNAVVVYDSMATGNNLGANCVFSATATNKISHPAGVTTGFDCIVAGGCHKYLWVSNLGTGRSGPYVTAYRIQGSGLVAAPVRNFSFSTGCTPGGALSAAYGIAHAKARLYLANEGTNQVFVFHSNATGPSCPFKTNNWAQLSTPSGPSVSFPTNATTEFVFNTNVNSGNAGTVTGFPQNTNGSTTPPSLLWSPGNVIVQGTATDWHLGYLWLSTRVGLAGQNALWLCTGLPLPGTCPSGPTIYGFGTGLNWPQFPSISVVNQTVFAPNYNGGTVTEYPENGTGPVAPIATFIGLTHPIGTAIENAPD